MVSALPILLGVAIAATSCKSNARAAELKLPSWAIQLVRRVQHDQGHQGMQPAEFVRLREQVVAEILTWSRTLPPLDHKLEYPYFAFLPNVIGTLAADGTNTVTYSNDCFGDTTFSLDAENSQVILEAKRPRSRYCSDLYLLATTSSWRIEHVTRKGQHTLHWRTPKDMSQAEEWDYATNGIRIFKFTTTLLETLHSIAATAALFEPLITRKAAVSPEAAERNVAFLNDYTGYKFRPRDKRLNRIPREEEIVSGDMFGIVRMDGLDPMLAWGMGATTGHVTQALWVDGELYICESNVKSSYWPQNNVQRTPYRQWIEWATDASFNVVHVPLAESYSSRYNATAALAWFDSVEGLAYGYHNMLWAWVDTLQENYPCLPPHYDRCLEWPFLEVAFAFLDRHIPPLSRLLWSEAFNIRVGMQNASTSEVYQRAAEQGLRSIEIPSIVEQDDWLYHTTRYERNNSVLGPAMVCCTFVCSMWKAAGVFGDLADQIQCGELTNADDAQLAIFRGDFRQILGDWTMFLPDFNSRPLFAHMDERCPSLPPDYKRPADC